MQERIYIIFSENRLPHGKVFLVTEKEITTSAEVIAVRGFEDALVKVSELIMKNKGKEFVIDFNDAPMHLMLATLSAFILLNTNATVLFDDLQLTISDVSPLKIPLTSDHVEVIKAIGQGFTSVGSISRNTGIPATSVWRRLRELEEEGVIDNSRKLTYKGKLLLSIYKS